MLFQLKAFVKDNGHARVPEKYPPNPSLARWIAYHRSKYKTGSGLPQHQQEALEALGMVWNPYESDWEECYKELVEFHKEHGHCMVPQTTQQGLGRWVAGQRYQYRLYQQGKPWSHMTQERIQLLNKIDFCWEPHEAIWMNHYRDLVEFQKEHGHWYVDYCCLLRCSNVTTVPFSSRFLTSIHTKYYFSLVPREYEELGRWVNMNRYQYKRLKDGKHPCSMTPERVQLLNKLDFVWNARDAAWYQRLSELEEFTKVNGRGLIPPVKTHSSLRNWLCRQIRLYEQLKKGKEVSLTEKRIAELERLGFL